MRIGGGHVSRRRLLKRKSVFVGCSVSGVRPSGRGAMTGSATAAPPPPPTHPSVAVRYGRRRGGDSRGRVVGARGRCPLCATATGGRTGDPHSGGRAPITRRCYPPTRARRSAPVSRGVQRRPIRSSSGWSSCRRYCCYHGCSWPYRYDFPLPATTAFRASRAKVTWVR